MQYATTTKHPFKRLCTYIIPLCILFVCRILAATPIQDHIIDPTALTELTVALDIPADADLIAETQKKWLRKPGQERWEIAELSPEQKQFVLHWAERNGLYAAWTPSRNSYDKAFLLGATTGRMQLRLNYLKELWLQGIRFQEIVFLTGDRPLDPRVDSLTEHCSTESEAAHVIWDTADLPDTLRNVPVLFIAVPMKQEGSSLKRPNTEDTILAWLRTNRSSCSALFISDQPFCGYQFSVIKACLPASIAFDVAGQGADPTSHPSAAAITLDSIARWLYQEKMNTLTRNKCLVWANHKSQH